MIDNYSQIDHRRAAMGTVSAFAISKKLFKGNISKFLLPDEVMTPYVWNHRIMYEVVTVFYW